MAGSKLLRELPRECQTMDVACYADRLKTDASIGAYGSGSRTAEFELLPLNREYEEVITQFPLSNDSHCENGVSVEGHRSLAISDKNDLREGRLLKSTWVSLNRLRK